MSGPLAAVERFFERLFERPAARLFQSQVDLAQIERTLERVMESDRRVQSRKSYVPTVFRVLLNDADAAALDGDRPIIARDLAESLRLYARAHGYVMLAQPRVEIGSSSSVPANDVRAYAEPVILPGNGNGNGHAAAAPTRPPAQSVGGSAPLDIVSEPTAVYAAPQNTAPKAQLAVRAPGHQVMRVPVRPGTRAPWAVAGQRHRSARRQGLAAPWPDRRPARYARIHRSRVHKRFISEWQRSHRDRAGTR